MAAWMASLLCALGALGVAWLLVSALFSAVVGKRWRRAKHRPEDSARFIMDQLQTTLLWRAGYGHFLSVEALADISLGSTTDSGLTASWLYPAHWSEEGGGAGPLSLAGLAGVLDVVSTLDIVHADGTHRPGVSVQLTLRLTPQGEAKRIAAGGRLVLKCGASKLGATLGFSELAVLDDDGALLAVGTHVKYLPPSGFGIGPIWQTLMHPWVLPLFYGRCFPRWRDWMDKRLERVHGKQLARPPPRPEQLMRLQQPTAVARAALRSSLLQSSAICGKTDQREDASVHLVALGPQHANPGGFVHGGALALAAAASGAKDQQDRSRSSANRGSGGAKTLVGIDVSYLGAVPAPTKLDTGKQLLLSSTSIAGGSSSAVRAFAGSQCVATVGLEWSQ